MNLIITENKYFDNYINNNTVYQLYIKFDGTNVLLNNGYIPSYANDIMLDTIIVDKFEYLPAMTIITKNFNINYLNTIENNLIYKFIKHLDDTIIGLNYKKEEYNKWVNLNKNDYINSINKQIIETKEASIFLTNTIRKNKILNIIK